MALEVWFKSDIQNALAAAELSGSAALRAAGVGDDAFVAGYNAGYRTALATLALAFGLAINSDHQPPAASLAATASLPRRTRHA